jgi:hypothetical protein
MSADISVIDPNSIARITGGDAVAFAALLATLETLVPASGDGDEGETLDAAETLAQVLAAFSPTEPLGDIGAQVNHYLQAQKIKLAPALRVRLMVSQNLFSALQEESPLDESLQRELQRLYLAFLASGLRDQDLFTNPQHVLRQFVDQLFHHGSVWYAQSGKEGGVFYEALVRAVDEITAAVRTNQPSAITTATTAFVTLAEKQHARAQMRAQRGADSELGMAKIHRAQARVVGLLESLNGCALPETVLQFVRSTLKSELQFLLINHSETDAAWQSWSAIIKRLPEVFPVLVPEADKPIEPDSPNRQQLYRDVQIIVGLLDEHVTVSTANQQTYDGGVEDLRECLFEKLRGISVPLFEFTPLFMPDELSLVGAAVSPSLLKKVASLNVGDWFLFHNNDDQVMRCKLLLRPPEIEQLLFVNRSGHRVLQKSVQDFSACLATQIVRPLVVDHVFSNALVFTLEKLQQCAEKNRALIENTATKAKSAVKKAAAAPVVVAPANEAPPPVLSPASDRKSAAHKALQEARVLAGLHARRERKSAIDLTAVGDATLTTMNDAPPGDGQRQQQVQSAVDNLNIGAWLDLPEAGSNTRQRCKLVAIMRSTDTFIFTNRNGVKVAEYERNHLVALLFNGGAEVHSKGDDFEGQLSKVVLTLRRDLS